MFEPRHHVIVGSIHNGYPGKPVGFAGLQLLLFLRVTLRVTALSFDMNHLNAVGFDSFGLACRPAHSVVNLNVAVGTTTHHDTNFERDTKRRSRGRSAIAAGGLVRTLVLTAGSNVKMVVVVVCLLYTSPSPRDS